MSEDYKSLTIDLTLDNDSFGEYPEYQVARILRKLADKIEDRGVGICDNRLSLHDSNGNTVGHACAG